MTNAANIFRITAIGGDVPRNKGIIDRQRQVFGKCGVGRGKGRGPGERPVFPDLGADPVFNKDQAGGIAGGMAGLGGFKRFGHGHAHGFKILTLRIVKSQGLPDHNPEDKSQNRAEDRQFDHGLGAGGEEKFFGKEFH